MDPVWDHVRVTFEAEVVQARAPHALARALAATAVVVSGAASAHTWAGGTVPTGPGLALVTVVVLAGGLLLFTRDVPVWALLPAVALAQLGLHEGFGLVAHHDHAAMAAMPGMPEQGWTWQMVLAHGSVTLATGLLWWLGRRAASYAVVLRRHATLPVAGRPLPAATEARTHPLQVHLLVPPRRGPPRVVAPA
ncbi:hypothetical protein SAMN04489844_2693 [Nocardioides exalbidus]|uniref:Uncharacterized protein n=1 Tax=Nocardioides exalbidus TaxID=402596 RepID=A0A1H4U7D3_9ACTN|nr:hypothetical protein SAMN04489844_2693 [Nocardioides exalbidus]